MKGDFSANHFRPDRGYLRVLMQQGRVQLDSDWNEQISILIRYLEALAEDVIGPFGGPLGRAGFAIQAASHLTSEQTDQLAAVGVKRAEAGDLFIGPGRYYVDGLLCENPRATTLLRQPDYTAEAVDADTASWVYLDVWERHLTWVQDDDVREVALGGPDTASRSRVIWQVKTGAFTGGTQSKNSTDWEPFDTQLLAESNALLRAGTADPDPGDQTDPCITPPAARYRGTENQLYRVEIHAGGTASSSGSEDIGATGATFKWSRENGSVVFPLANPAEGEILTLTTLGRDDTLTLDEGDWVELCDDDLDLSGLPGQLLQVRRVDAVGFRVTLSDSPKADTGRDMAKHPLLRRWDQKERDPASGAPRLIDGAAVVEEDDQDAWLALEDGIQIQFQPGGAYRTGDYWLIPARTETGDVQWPRSEEHTSELQ